MRFNSRRLRIPALLAAVCLPVLFAQAGGPAPAAAADKKPFLRGDAFFGLHFDLHPNDTDTALGADVTDAMVGGLLDRIKPDYVQYDCKGHVGWAGYPTKVGWPAPGIKKDSLEIWRRVTRPRSPPPDRRRPAANPSRARTRSSASTSTCTRTRPTSPSART
jgi:hypothetical protein